MMQSNSRVGRIGLSFAALDVLLLSLLFVLSLFAASTYSVAEPSVTCIDDVGTGCKQRSNGCTLESVFCARL